MTMVNKAIFAAAKALCLPCGNLYNQIFIIEKLIKKEYV